MNNATAVAVNISVRRLVAHHCKKFHRVSRYYDDVCSAVLLKLVKHWKPEWDTWDIKDLERIILYRACRQAVIDLGKSVSHQTNSQREYGLIPESEVPGHRVDVEPDEIRVERVLALRSVLEKCSEEERELLQEALEGLSESDHLSARLAIRRKLGIKKNQEFRKLRNKLRLTIEIDQVDSPRVGQSSTREGCLAVA